MKLAIASGKGGTGKTTVAANLAWVAAARGLAVTYVDCDVEEPNGALFLHPQLGPEQAVTTPIPEVNPAACRHCGECGRVCQFSAIVTLGDQVLVVPELCHGCGACARACPGGAIREVPCRRGAVATGQARAIRFVQGRLDIGQPAAPPVVRAAKALAGPSDLVVFDGPPGAACPAVEAIRGADLVLLVAEPTPFGRHDLGIALETTALLGLPTAVVVNRADGGALDLRAQLQPEGIPILAEFAFDRRVAEVCSRGELAAAVLSEARAGFERLLDAVLACRQEVRP